MALLSKFGCLYIVATPIGNLKDITQRALEVLSMVDLVVAEDTRRSGQLLTYFGLSKTLISLHEHNEASQCFVIIRSLLEGKDIALVCNAGTPLISDPGFRLVDQAYDKGLKVIPVPGPSSVITALSAAGISTAAYSFVGFLPSKDKQRQRAIQNIKYETKSLVLFESPHRIIKSLQDLVVILGEQRKASFCRELTKRFETIFRGSLSEIKIFVERDENQRRGEIVLVVSGSGDDEKCKDIADYEILLKGMMEYMPIKKAASLLAQVYSRPRKYFYQMGLKIKDDI